MRRIHAGDPDALGAVMDRYWSPLLAYARRLLDDPDAAEDIVQETMLSLWRERNRWTPSQRLQGFLYRIARNLSLNERKKRQVRRNWVATRSHEAAPQSPTPLDTTEEAELRALLDRLIAELPERRREVFILARYHGHSYRQIAEIMGISPQTVANHMSAALDALREGARPHLDTFADRRRFRVITGGRTRST